jgi:protein-S-isoprenylcysteine O-methyltransferase Ste14
MPLDPRTIGVIILSLLALLVVVKRVATGTVLGERPQGGLGLWVSHVYNMSFLLVVNPLAGLLLVARRLALDPTHLAIQDPRALALCQVVGLVLSVAGYALMAWALLALRTSYQPGGCAPRAGDQLVVAGPYGLIRHPMYTAALLIALGLACLTQSLACVAVLASYVVLIGLLVPVEEGRLQHIYGEAYVSYQRRVGRLAPLMPR